MAKGTRSALPTLERKPGGPDNWVERVGGLPQYIDRIARHLHYDKGMDIGHAIATAVNTVKRWARKGTVVKYNDPKTNHVTTITAAQAAADVADWEAKKARARGTSGRSGGSGRLRTRSVKLSEVAVDVVALKERANAIADPEARAEALSVLFDLAVPKPSTKCKFCSNPPTKRILHAEGMAYIDVCDKHLAKGKEDCMKATPDGTRDPSNINSITDLSFPAGGPKTATRRKMASKGSALPDGSFPIDDIAQLRKAIKAFGRAKDKAKAKRHIIKRARSLGALDALPQDWTAELVEVAFDLALTKDGRKSFKRQGKWGHGFVPLDAKAKESKAKGSPIAAKRMERLYGSPSKAQAASKKATQRTLARRDRLKAKGEKPNAREKTLKIQTKSGGTKASASQRVSRAALAMQADIRDATVTQRTKPRGVEVGRGRRSAPRATKNWNEIADAYKTIRNGKRYVVANFNGQNIITEWQGPNPQNEPKDITARSRPTMTTQDINNLTTAEMRKMLKQANLAPDVRKRIAKALKQKALKAQRSEKK